MFYHQGAMAHASPDVTAALATLLGGPLGNASFPFLATRPVSSARMRATAASGLVRTRPASSGENRAQAETIEIWPSTIASKSPAAAK